MSDPPDRSTLLRFYDALHQLLTDGRPLEEGQMIDEIRKRLVIDSIGMRSLADPFPTVHLTFRRRQLPEEALVMTVGLAEPLYGDMSDKEILRAAWHTLLPLMEADRSGETNPAVETVTRWRG